MKLRSGTIVLVADGSKMLLLRNRGDEQFPDLRVVGKREIANPPSHEQMSDAPGVVFSSHGFGRSAYPAEDPHEEAAEQFAVETAGELAEYCDKEAGDVVVVAPPDTLGVLRRHYAPSVKHRLVAEIDKDLTKHPVPEIAKLIARAAG